MKRIFTSACLVAFLAGALVGPGYLLYCTHFSGSSVGEHELFSRDITPVAIRGVTKRVIKGENDPIPPVSMHLSPEMNPIGLGLAGRYIRPFGGISRNEYSITLSYNTTQEWEETVMVQGKRDDKQGGKRSVGDVKVGKMGLDSFSIHAKTFQVTKEGDYTVRVKRTGHPDLHVADMKIKVRRNVLVPNKTVVMFGCIALGVGLVGLVIIGIINKKKHT